MLSGSSFLCKLTASVITMPFPPIIMFYVVRLFSQRAFHRLYKIGAAQCQAAQTEDSRALGRIIGHGQDLAIGRKAMGGSLDHLICRLPTLRKQHFDFRL